MMTPFSRAPHVDAPSNRAATHHAPNAALLIDFDNVTMGMRSDLSKELRQLLNSDVIKGKVAVQRAYADWRRYPQYIVPLAENSVDLIFAPAYGSSKKNATDIRMAIDGMELIFTRPEIGTFILLTGDSDFSSLVLKLKEYGKYVIGVGIQESSSDLLVQNCDEYYSYTVLTGLRRAGEEGSMRSAMDPWVLVERAIEQMAKRRDVMRSDRLKQVMLEMDPGFDEGALGFSKFSRFLTEAAQKGLLSLTKLDNGQFEVSPGAGSAAASSASGPAPAERPGRRRDRGRDDARSRDRDRERTTEMPAPIPPAPAAPGAEDTPTGATAPAAEVPAPTQPSAVTIDGPGTDAPSLEAMRPALALLRKAVLELAPEVGHGVRDSDVKRRMLVLDGSFDEGSLGFPKFSRFLRHAHELGEIELRKSESGIQEVVLREATPPGDTAGEAAPAPAGATVVTAAPAEVSAPKAVPAPTPTLSAQDGERRLQPRVSRRGGRGGAPPLLLEGQVVLSAGAGVVAATPAAESPAAGKDELPVAEPVAASVETPSAEPVAETKRPRSRRGRKADPVDAMEAAPTEPVETAAETPPVVEPTGPAAVVEEPAPRARRSRTPKGRGAEAAEAAEVAEAVASASEVPAEVPAEGAGAEESAAPARRRRTRAAKSEESPLPPEVAAPPVDEQGRVNPVALGLPTDPEAVVAYLTTAYKGVGRKTAESLVAAFGPELFTVLNTLPQKVKNTVAVARAELVLDGWRADLARRLAGDIPPPIVVAAPALSVAAPLPPVDEDFEDDDGPQPLANAPRDPNRRRGRRGPRKGGRGGGGGKKV